MAAGRGLHPGKSYRQVKATASSAQGYRHIYFVFNYASPGVASDLEGYKQTVTNLCTPFADIHSIIEDMVAEGDKVAVRWTWRGTHKGEAMGIAPTGKQVAITGINILHIVAGKIIEEWGEMDMLSMMQQLGVFPPQG